MSAGSILTLIIRELILPPSSLFAVIATGFVLSRLWPRAGRTLSVTALLALVVLSTNAGARVFVLPLEALTAPLPFTRNTGAQAIEVLAAGRVEHAPEYGNKDIPDYIALARLRYVAKLQHETGLPVLVSGGNGTPDGAVEPLAGAMARALRDDFATPVEWMEGASDNTAENAAFSAKILKQHGAQRILLVTDAMHMLRSTKTFERSGLEVVAAPTMFFSANELSPFSFLPSAKGLRRSHYALYEWVGLVWYSIRHVA